MARKTERGNMERYLVKRLFISMRRKNKKGGHKHVK